jgi:hypothetical protein
MVKITAPLKVPKTKKKDFILNLNNYRNTHFQTLNKTKINYKALLKQQIGQLSNFNKVIVEYKIFPQSRRRTDIGNVASVHQKFFEDAFVEFGKIVDDSYDHVLMSLQSFGEVDKHNPRVEIRIIEIPEGDSPYEHLIRFK